MTGDVATPRLVGASVLRSEDPRYLTGGGCYVADLELPRMLEAVFVRSPHAHAVVRSVAGPGTGPVLSWSDLAGTAGPLVPPSRVPTYRATPYFPLAADRVRFVGEAVALALASDRARAEALAEEVEVDYEPLAAVVEVGDALAPGAVTLHDGAPDNVLVERSVGDPAALEEALSGAAVVLRRRFRHGRLVGVPIEGRGCVAHYDRAQGTLRLWSSTQIPHLLRTYLAGLLDLPEHRIQVVAPDVGGGFGI
ncbi:MAG TPA: molybdopterin cofactor-binding domain-containing protein, partial [Acidimicrobiales bacterium]|nr:molybdopterin cofactor-binding domain-containing protein [Acidimicrobiales bacterium]